MAHMLQAPFIPGLPGYYPTHIIQVAISQTWETVSEEERHSTEQQCSTGQVTTKGRSHLSLQSHPYLEAPATCGAMGPMLVPRHLALNTFIAITPKSQPH